MLSIIAAVSDNYAIGLNNDMPWRLPEDLKRFAQITMGKSIIMGRKTFEALPRVLPNRKHIVVTNSYNYKFDDDMVEITNDLNGILIKYRNLKEETFVIGGEKIFLQALPYCTKLYITHVFGNFDADTYFPKVSLDEYDMVEMSDIYTDKLSQIKYQFTTYIKK